MRNKYCAGIAGLTNQPVTLHHPFLQFAASDEVCHARYSRSGDCAVREATKRSHVTHRCVRWQTPGMLVRRPESRRARIFCTVSATVRWVTGHFVTDARGGWSERALARRADAIISGLQARIQGSGLAAPTERSPAPALVESRHVICTTTYA